MSPGRRIQRPLGRPRGTWIRFAAAGALSASATSVPVEVYDPATGTFAPDGTTPGIATSATLLRSGRILLTGTVGTPASGEALGTWSVIYDPITGRAETTASPRAWFAAPAALVDGRVLFAGGGLPDPKGGWPPDPVHWLEIFE